MAEPRIVFPLDEISGLLTALGATQVLVKHLAPNDNSKNQIYLAGDVSALGLLPMGDVVSSAGRSMKSGADRRGPIFRTALDFWWLGEDKRLHRAPHAKLILYPQYSEVRLSGFLKDCEAPPSDLFDITRDGRQPGRTLVLAPLPDGRIIAAAFGPERPESGALREACGEAYGVLKRFELGGGDGNLASEALLVKSLGQIHDLGWIAPVYLQSDGSFRPCRGSNCGGVTLESQLGIRANGSAEPDFHGWEVKQHGVASFNRPSGSRITLMTPEPSGGAYFDKGPEHFIRTWGYSDRAGRFDRINFGGNYKNGAAANPLTQLRMILVGFDQESGAIEGNGSLNLIDSQDRIAASWSFEKLMNHWRRKHAHAVFVPSVVQREPQVMYRYGRHVALAEGAKFKLLLRAFASGQVYYDPGMKIENASTPASRVKRRSQFRIGSKGLPKLYDTYRKVDVGESQ